MTTGFITCFIAGSQWIIILLVILLLFGGKKIPELMRGVGKGVRAFKEGMNEVDESLSDTPKSKTTVVAENKAETKDDAEAEK